MMRRMGMKTLLPTLILVVLMAGCAGRDNSLGPNWNIPEPKQTGVVPEVGGYDFLLETTVDYVYVAFSIASQGEQRNVVLTEGYNDGTDYHTTMTFPIYEGGFRLYNGDISGYPPAPGNRPNHYPADGYAISGWFVGPKRAVGVIQFAHYGVIIGESQFTATLKQ